MEAANIELSDDDPGDSNDVISQIALQGERTPARLQATVDPGFL